MTKHAKIFYTLIITLSCNADNKQQINDNEHENSRCNIFDSFGLNY